MVGCISMTEFSLGNFYRSFPSGCNYQGLDYGSSFKNNSVSLFKNNNGSSVKNINGSLFSGRWPLLAQILLLDLAPLYVIGKIVFPDFFLCCD